CVCVCVCVCVLVLNIRSRDHSSKALNFAHLNDTPPMSKSCSSGWGGVADPLGPPQRSVSPSQNSKQAANYPDTNTPGNNGVCVCVCVEECVCVCRGVCLRLTAHLLR